MPNWCQRGRRQGAKPFESAPTPQGVTGRVEPLASVRSFRFLKTPRGSRPCRRPLQKVHQKVIKNQIRKFIRFLTPNGLPKGPSKSQISDKICKIGNSNTFRELFGLLSFQKWFPSRLQGPLESQKLFYRSKTIIFRNPL